ncbi:FtsX-like permease family protein [Blastococcus sp. CT_GayMR20]|uniref:FtsX-like permease family protein n=1 Tax=Blastococcus sp. CT_GayMR20 TaxID=2559609 RepID=UPI00107473AB|nr:FtsX-like permease family protein [Blastococcus sp. CT_GayMR20]TFV91797.1 FtsX-like permease family protein [Blastococcus sp. CT_GayMR20]TFV91803.1 FtsX-like permease family protein [Blastococcus sp. CT_GayMR20]
MSGWVVRWRLALRIARRDALRHRGRTLLVLAMVGLPVMAVVGADTFFRTADLSPVEEAAIALGSADAQIVGEAREQVYADPETGATWHQGAAAADPPWTADEVAGLLPEGSRVVETVEGRVTYRTDVGRAALTAFARDSGDPLLDGTFTLGSGRLPREDGEVAISRPVADRGYVIGDTLELTTDEVSARVVGVVSRPGRDEPFLVLPETGADLLTGPLTRFLVRVPGGLDWAGVQELNARGLLVVSREVVADPPSPAEWLPPDEPADMFESDPAGQAVLALVVASVVLEVVLLAGPAFAVGVRRQRRDLALIGAAGGSAADLRRVVLASGVVLGGGAAVLGAGLGVVLARLGGPVVEPWTGRSLGPFEVPLLDVAVIVLVGFVAGLGAAWFPARQAARTDIVETLAGRRGQVRTSWRSPLLGFVLAAAGLLLVVLGARGAEIGVAAGAVLLIVGLVTASPWLVGLLAPLGSRLPVPGRLAVRDATRNRSRTAPAMAAVMATVAGVTALSIGSASDSAQARRDYVPLAPLGTALITGDIGERAWADVEAVLREQAPERAVHRIRAVPWVNGAMRELAVLRPGCSGSVEECRWWLTQPVTVTGGYGEVVSLDAATAHDLIDASLRNDVARELGAGRVVVLGTGAVADDGTVALATVEYEDTGGGQYEGSVTATASLPASYVPLPTGELVQLPAVILVPPVLADRLPLEVQTTTLVTGGPDDPVTPEQEQQMQEAIGVLSGVAGVSVERGWQDDLAVARYVLSGLAALLVLVATLTATGLALTDARPDFATLAAVGAAPRTRRLTAMGSAAVVGGGGALLGVLVGLAPGIAVAYPLTAGDGFGTPGGQAVIDVPWLLLGGVAVLVPLLAVAVTGLAVRSELPMSRRIA